VAVSRFADKKEMEKSLEEFTLHFSFAFCVLGIFVGSAAVIVLLVDRLRNKESWTDA
jgi:hypothetical protein